MGLVDLAPTFCAIAGVEPRRGCRARRLPVDDADADARGFERVLTEWDSELFGTDVHLRTIMRDHWVCSAYLPGTSHDGTEGELYDLDDDPLQQANRWDDPALRPRSATTWWPTCGTTSPRPGSPGWPSRRRSDSGPAPAPPSRPVSPAAIGGAGSARR